MSNIIERDLHVTGGRLRLRDYGGRGRLALCVPGLSANATSFDLLGERLAGDDHHVVSVDLRGRGFSEVTPPGTYGWPAHARDVLDVIAALSGDPADLIGHSMGTYVAMSAATIEPHLLRSLVLIDGLGRPEAAALVPIEAGLRRLGVVHPSADAYVDLIRSVGSVQPWSELWERYFRYDLEEVEGGVRSRTSLEAVLEDWRWGEENDQRDLWPAVTVPVLVVRALVALGGGFVLAPGDIQPFTATAPHATVVEVGANHYTVVTDEATAAAVRAFLDAA